ncbi:MAG: hypothetical protein HYR84_11955 [Planctomycetes bacterium]|nr:hypothetical protein [Planctomycetota bacterium]
MHRLLFTIALCSLLGLGASAAAQESPKVQVTLKIPAKTPSFQNLRLVATLSHNHPAQPDRGKRTVASHVDAKFSHQQGKETVVTIQLGNDVKLNREVQYFVLLNVFDSASKRTHVGEMDGRAGPFGVVTNEQPRALMLILRPTP